MYNHAPEGYACPICLAASGVEDERTWIMQKDIFYKGWGWMGFISSKFIKGNEGHAIVVPTKHYENIFEIPQDRHALLFSAMKTVSRNIKATRQCDGITIVQNNEPAGDQHAFHYHAHIVPRFTGDSFHEEFMKATRCRPEDRIPYAEALYERLERSL